MMPVDLVRMQMAMAFGLLDMQQKMVSGAFQMALWWMPGVATAAPGAGNICAPSGRRRTKG
ncbi:MAG: hypothetical protein O9292_11360 [Rhodobacteraceae bacterium]|nr:hypothetical protein [Paracoccaceae bacterium]MCZ8152966.1 hypothetical protein [Paracoccaceae bacterium]MCZ8335650.1 hypothetical protein [Paracoccaceae bacterium]